MALQPSLPFPPGLCPAEPFACTAWANALSGFAVPAGGMAPQRGHALWIQNPSLPRSIHPIQKTGNPNGLPVFSRRALWQYPGAARQALKGFLAASGPFHRFLPVCLTLTGPPMGRTRPKRFGPMVPYHFPQPLSVSIKASVHFSGKLNIPIVILYPLM